MSAPSTDEDGIRQTIRALTEDGWVLLHVNDGEEEVPVTNEDEAIKAVTAVDDAYLFVTKEAKRGWVRFVLGNDPDEVICDHTINLTPLDRLTDEWIEATS